MVTTGERSIVPLVIGLAGTPAIGAISAALSELGATRIEVTACAAASEGAAMVAPRFDSVITAVGAGDATCEWLDATGSAYGVDGWAVFAGSESRSFVRAHGEVAGATVRRISLHRSISGITIAEYRRIFATHLLITRDHMSAVWGYRQTDVANRSGPLAWPVDGVSEFWFSTEGDLADPYRGSAADKAAVQADSRLFVDASTAITLTGVELRSATDEGIGA